MRTIVTCLFLASVPVASSQTTAIDIHFESARWELSTEHAATIDSLIELTGATFIESISLEGHTDSIGSIELNRVLADKRVQSVKQALIRNGIPDSIISTALIVTDRPIADNSSKQGRALNRRVHIVIRHTATVEDPGIWNEIAQGCLKDTIIVIDDRLRFRASKCQALYCLSSYSELSFSDLIASDLSTVSLNGQVNVMCGIYRSTLWDECDSLVVFDPPLRMEVTVPKGITTNVARQLFGTFSGEGRWLDQSGDRIKVQMKREGDRTIAVFNVHRLAPAFSVCCGGQPRYEPLRLRLRLRGVPNPTRIMLYGQDPIYSMDMEHKRGTLWRSDRKCDLGTVVRLEYGARSDSTWTWVAVPLSILRHRTQILGRKCARIDQDVLNAEGSNRPVKKTKRSMHRTYLVRQRDIDQAKQGPE